MNNLYKSILFYTLLFVSIDDCLSQNVFQIQVPNFNSEIKSGHLKMGDHGDPAILINNRYMTIGGEPVLPVMGEIHYSRVNKARWEEYVLKMKANGINTIASYVLWIHHEEIEGEIDWYGNKNLREFVALCQKHDLMFVARIGPWCHAEVRNGGTPDWIFDQTNLKDRSNNPEYQKYAKRWYAEISKQLEGLYWKDGGPIIGIQFENEYRRGPKGDAHILWLKQTAQELGMDVPMYTVTGWGNASVPENEVIPLYGGYPTAPWTTNIQPLKNRNAFLFETAVNDPTIGNESGKLDLPRVDLSGYPYFTCELGVGNQISYHRRPIIDPLDGVTIAMAKVGSGSNLPGYYVFAGGSNPGGKLTSLEEDQDDTGYWNAYPKISYDFQAAIRETGELAQSYHELKALHYFLNEFGSDLAPMMPVLYEEKETASGLQIALRTDGESGFLFGLNYQRNHVSKLVENASFEIKLKDETVSFPKVDIPANCNFIWPVNMKMNNQTLKYATCQPVTKVEGKRKDIWVFVQTGNIVPEFTFDEPITLKVNEKKITQCAFQVKAGLDQSVSWKGKKENQILVIPQDLAKQIWVMGEKLFITEADIYLDGNELSILSKESKNSILALKETPLDGLELVENGAELFSTYSIDFHTHTPYMEVTRCDSLRGEWLKTSSEEVTSKNELHHRLFSKEITIDNTSDIKMARLTYFTDQTFRIRVNEKWVNQTVKAEELNTLDLTAYLRQGKNAILVDFPIHEQESAWIGELEVLHNNMDKWVMGTGSHWHTGTQYTLPRPFGLFKYQDSEIVNRQSPALNSGRYQVKGRFNSELHSLYLNINYVGDRAEMYSSGTLISDNFWNGTTWSTNVKDLAQNSFRYEIEITPLKEDYKIFFDQKPDTTGIAEISKVDLVPEYKTVVRIQN